ncbi:DnaJ family domain-containing protein, partial [Paenibacillus larvae]
MDNLPGQGKPLVLENWSSVPEDLRLAYKILKNSGHLPEE